MTLTKKLLGFTAASLLLAPSFASARFGSFPDRGFVLSLSNTRYNRVEGLFLGANALIAPPGWRGVGIFGSGGYGHANKQWRYEAGLEVRGKTAGLSAAYFNRTASLDDSLITVASNTLLALFTKRDYKDYYQARDGFELLASHTHKKVLWMSARASIATLKAMPVTTNWSIFRRDDPFRANPGIAEGKEGSISATLALDTRGAPSLSRSGTYLGGTFERRFRDFEDSGLSLAVRRYQVMPFGNQTLVLRGAMVSRTNLAIGDSLRLLYLGGIGTLRGYAFREMSGNRLLVLNADYLFRNALKFLDLVVFFDTGWIGRRPSSSSLLSGFGDLQWSDFKSDVGLAIGLTGQMIRLDFARRLDRRHASWTVTIQGRKAI